MFARDETSLSSEVSWLKIDEAWEDIAHNFII